MLCEKCGAAINENIRICPQCGTPIRGEEQNITSNSTYQGPLGNTTPVLVWGIIGLAFALIFYFNILGIIFSIVGLKKANAYNEFTGDAQSKKVKIGKKLSIAGVIVGSISFVLMTIWLVVLFLI